MSLLLSLRTRLLTKSVAAAVLADAAADEDVAAAVLADAAADKDVAAAVLTDAAADKKFASCSKLWRLLAANCPLYENYLLCKLSSIRELFASPKVRTRFATTLV